MEATTCPAHSRLGEAAPTSTSRPGIDKLLGQAISSLRKTRGLTVLTVFRPFPGPYANAGRSSESRANNRPFSSHEVFAIKEIFK